MTVTDSMDKDKRQKINAKTQVYILVCTTCTYYTTCKGLVTKAHLEFAFAS